MSYVDLLLIHFPGSNDAVQSPQRNRRLRLETWEALERAKAFGKARALGVANFTRRHLRELLQSCRERPDVVQMEVSGALLAHDVGRFIPTSSKLSFGTTAASNSCKFKLSRPWRMAS